MLQGVRENCMLLKERRQLSFRPYQAKAATGRKVKKPERTAIEGTTVMLL